MRIGRVAWAVGFLAILVLFGWQVWYASQLTTCGSDGRLELCAGPLDGWLLPVTVLLGLAFGALFAIRRRTAALVESGDARGAGSLVAGWRVVGILAVVFLVVVAISLMWPRGHTIACDAYDVYALDGTYITPPPGATIVGGGCWGIP